MTTTSTVPLLISILACLSAVWPCDAQSLRRRPSGRQGADANMNGEYVLSQTPGAKHTQSRLEKASLASSGDGCCLPKVFWKGLPPIDLPKHIVDAFDGKGMAIIGYEADQVRRTPDGDVSVPLSVAYNHHYHGIMVGKGVHFEKVVFNGPDDPRLHEMMSGDMGHGSPAIADELWMVVDDDDKEEQSSSRSGLPTSQSIDFGNGGEYRKTFKGYAPGYVQVVGSPTQFQLTPMQIDTWNRDEMDLTNPTKFVAGPLPRSSQAPPNASYSGLLECPLTTRITKEYDPPLVVQQDQCKVPIAEAQECQRAAERLLQGSGVQLKPVVTGKDPSAPAGCSLRASANGGIFSAEAFMNTLPSGSGAKSCGEGAQQFGGAASSFVTVKVSIDVAKDEVVLNLTGPSDVWFGVGFNAKGMYDSPWTIIIDGHGEVTERQLTYVSLGELLKTSVKVVSSTTAAGRRTVVLSRPVKGLTSKHYTFDPRGKPQLNFINAIGNGPDLAQHKAMAPSSLVLLPLDTAGDCVCAVDQPFGSGQGRLRYNPTNQSVDVGRGAVHFKSKCQQQPSSDCLAQRNPTCDFRTYAGGEIVCQHMWSLLDADQPIPWPDRPLTYQLKFRFFVQEYNASYHEQLGRKSWGIAGPIEFDVPKCGPGKAGCELGPDGTWFHTITGTFVADGRLAHANFHCHAPACLNVSLYRCPRGTRVCNASNGELLCREEPVYGKGMENRFDELGYIFQPPCIWGSTEYGLEPPPELGGYVLGAVKISNATYGHYGEMSLQQCLILPSHGPASSSSSARRSSLREPEQKMHRRKAESNFNV